MTERTWVGLNAAGVPVPLEGVNVDARMSGSCVEVCVMQCYCNREATPIESVYIFPLDEGSTVHGFSARIGGKTIVAQVLPREQAFARYDDAMLHGDGAFLLEQERPNVFTAAVGNLLPGQRVQIEIRYVTLAAREGDALRLVIPTVVAPRYAPPAGREVGQPAAERVNPPRAEHVSYGLALRVEVRGQPRRVECPSHPLRTILQADGVIVELAQGEHALDRDFVLYVEPNQSLRAFARVACEPDGSRVAYLCWLPELQAVASAAVSREVVFMLDCSGSMHGTSIEQAKRALALCIRALSPGDTFNLVRFGSTHQTLWPEARAFDGETLDVATDYVEAVLADLGGTEIAAPLREVLASPLADTRTRCVLLLTDGHVSNEFELFALARTYAAHSRVFTFGIGASVSEFLVQGLARASRAAAEMVHPGERMEPKVMRMFARLHAPWTLDVHIDWHGLRVVQAPEETPPLFFGDALSVFARIEHGAADHVTLHAGDQSWRVPLELEQVEGGGPIIRLWARARIRELEERNPSRKADPERDAELVALGQRYGLLSSATSLVAAEARELPEYPQSSVKLRRIPVALNSGRRSRPQPHAAMAHSMSRGSAATYSDEEVGVPTRGGSRARGKPALAAGSPAGRDLLFELLMTQSADGSFGLSDALALWLGDERTRKLRSVLDRRFERIAITEVVIALLKSAAGHRKLEWTPAVDKASAWLAAQAARFDASVVLDFRSPS